MSNDLKNAGEIDIEELSAKRVRAYSNFKLEFSIHDPEELEPDQFSFKELGLRFWIVLVTGIAAVVQASLRTGAKFMQLAEQSSWGPTLQKIDGATAMIGVEGIIFMAGWFIGSQKQEKDGEVSEKEMDIAKRPELYIALAIALVISMVTGGSQAAEGSKNISADMLKWIDWAILVMLGPGASILAFFAGELVGIVVLSAEAGWNKRYDAWKTNHANWQAQLSEAWENSEIYKLLHIDIQGASDVAQSAYGAAAKAAKRVYANVPPVRVNEEEQQQTLSLSKRVLEFLDANGWTVANVGSHEGAKISVKQLGEDLHMTSEHFPNPDELAKVKKYLTKVMADLRKKQDPI